MAEYQDPPLRLAIEGMRWMGDEFKPTGEAPAILGLHDTDDGEDAAAVLRALRRIASRRLQNHLLIFSLGWQELDFDSPNAPTEEDVQSLVQHVEHIHGAILVLRQLAAEVIPDEDDDDD